MKNTHVLKKTWMFLAFVTILSCLLFDGRVNATPVQSAPSASQQSAPSTNDRYAWPGELVALDEGAGTMTVKAMVAGPATDEFSHFKAGDKVTVTWSGYGRSADAINAVVRYDASKKSDALFTFPVEFVSYDAARSHATFKLRIPKTGIDVLKSLKPGEWFRATSLHHPSSETDIIVTLTPYVGSTTNG